MKLNEIRIPELAAVWRWPRAVSPYLSEVEQESLDWSASFNPFDPETQQLVHEKGKLSAYNTSLRSSDLLAAMCYAGMPKALRASSSTDRESFFFVEDTTSRRFLLRPGTRPSPGTPALSSWPLTEIPVLVLVEAARGAALLSSVEELELPNDDSAATKSASTTTPDEENEVESYAHLVRGFE
ncbi:hypothetical protein B0T18DRAFT_391623 [Schizothecium vesticola]|uniref:Uncharacterized protein n=1 Tax=Schizothecium vesticola TaxID=314040 RepID=A0AA40ENQ8_9PEZI|nr:hypothetical protein B0T18DRAFT_391623 [Schizothecium vesticola]